MKIVENAIKFTPPGGTITVSTERIGRGRLVITTQDTGIGIAPEHHARIFDRFFRVDKARTERGAGLGLSIAQAVVAAHGGTITVESEPGAGSIFRVYLPLRPPGASE